MRLGSSNSWTSSRLVDEALPQDLVYEDEKALLVQTLSLFEVYRHLVRHLGRDEPLSVVAAMRQGTVMDLDDRLALDAAALSVARTLALAQSIMLATSRARGGVFWAQDADFEGFDGVRLKGEV